MNAQEDKKGHTLLKQSVTPVSTELKRDLWPQMVERMEQKPLNAPWFSAMFSREILSVVPWFDWALAGVLVVGVCVFPKSIPIWLYHL